MTVIDMKGFLLSLAILLSCLTFKNLEDIKEIKDKSIIDLLGSLVTTNTYSADDFFVSIFKKENAYGSAGNESGEITHSFYFVISDSDDFPKQTVFEIGDFYGPEISNVKTLEESINVEISYYKDRKKVFKTYKVYHHRVTE